jgi:hypothetical protein
MTLIARQRNTCCANGSHVRPETLPTPRVHIWNTLGMAILPFKLSPSPIYKTGFFVNPK